MKIISNKNLRRLVGAVALALTGSLAAAPIVVTSHTNASADSGYTDVSVVVSTSAIVSDVDLEVGWGKCGSGVSNGLCSGGGFPYPGEAYMTLFGPTGVQVALFPNNYFTGPDSSVDVVNLFDDEALLALPTTISNGTYRPVNPLSAFDGTNAAGTWTLRIGDTVGADPIVLDYFTLTLNGHEAPSGIPVPAPLALLALGVAGLGLRLRGLKAAR